MVVGHGDVGGAGNGLEDARGQASDQAVGRVGEAFAWRGNDMDTSSEVRAGLGGCLTVLQMGTRRGDGQQRCRYGDDGVVLHDC